jgi:uncharacterized protein (TIGR04255 family)
MAYFPEDRPLPKRLENEPLIEAVFEMRFSSTVPASEVFPGFLFGKLGGKKDEISIESLPAAQVPKPLRDNDPNLQFVPVIRLKWKKHIISISDRSVVIGCDYPYPKWGNFKPSIIKVMEHLKEINIIDFVSRYSMKYVDLIVSNNIAHQISLIDMLVSVAGYELKDKNFQIRMELPEKDFVNIVQILPNASANLSNGEKRDGIIIDVDTIYNIDNLKIENVINNYFDSNLEKIHTTNKRMFFSCLTEETIKSLGPVYE